MILLSLTLKINAQNFNYSKDFKKILKETKKEKSSLYYEKLLPRFKKGDTTLTDKQVLALQIAFTKNDNYNPYGVIEEERLFIRDSRDTSYAETCIKFGTKALEFCPLDLAVNYALYKSHKYKGNLELSKQFQNRYNMLIKSILYSGDGEKNPFFVLSPIDGQILIKEYWKNDIGMMGSGRDKKGNFLDMLGRIEDDGSETTLYFNCEHAVKLMFK